MGMSASQARYLGLIARQNDLEYQGQQINQERTVLSQQVTDLYNTLQNMNVPTPPSTSDYTKVIYSGTDGATPFTLGNIIPTGDTYTVDFNYKKTGHYLEAAGSAIVTPLAANISLSTITLDDLQQTELVPAKTAKTYSVPTDTVEEGVPVDDETWMMCNVGANPTGNGTYYVIDGGEFVQVTEENKSQYTGQTRYEMRQALTVEGESGPTSNYKTGDYIFGEEPAAGTKVTQEAVKGVTRETIVQAGIYAIQAPSATQVTDVNFNNFFSVDSDGRCSLKSNVTIGQEAPQGSGTTYQNADSNVDGAYKVAGNLCYTFDGAIACGAMTEESAKNYLQAIRDTFPEQANLSDSVLKSNYRVYFTKSNSGTLVPHFVATDALTNNLTDVNNNKYVDTYDYSSNGTYTAAQSQADCKLTFDTSGRITKIEMPTKYENGVPVAYKTLNLEAKTETDENAYKDAYNKYEYNKYLYDKEQQEINAKTEVIQQEDKKLELKLQRLDNERTQITTEIEAVEKVINDNIESTYKTFSG